MVVTMKICLGQERLRDQAMPWRLSMGRIAALTRGTKLAVPQAHASESHRGQVPCSAALARRGKALDEGSAAIHADALAAA